MSSKKITFSIPDWMYDGLTKHLSIINSQYRVDDFFKCAAINRFIDIGVFDEFGQPFPVPELNVDSKNIFPSWSELTGGKNANL